MTARGLARVRELRYGTEERDQDWEARDAEE